MASQMPSRSPYYMHQGGTCPLRVQAFRSTTRASPTFDKPNQPQQDAMESSFKTNLLTFPIYSFFNKKNPPQHTPFIFCNSYISLLLYFSPRASWSYPSCLPWDSWDPCWKPSSSAAVSRFSSDSTRPRCPKLRRTTAGRRIFSILLGNFI